MNIKTAALQQNFTTYELSRMPDIVRNSPEALEYCIWLYNEAIAEVEEADDEE